MKTRLLVIMIFLVSLSVSAEDSSVFTCTFNDSFGDVFSLRMKKYFSQKENMFLGKVDLLRDEDAVESTPTKVYQIQINSESYMQIWNSQNLRVDAQLSYVQGVKPFKATYTKNNQKQYLNCHELRD